jgi:hypothetical protein
MHGGRFLMHMMEKWTLEVDGVALFSWKEKAVLAKGTRLNPEVGCFGIYTSGFQVTRPRSEGSDGKRRLGTGQAVGACIGMAEWEGQEGGMK